MLFKGCVQLYAVVCSCMQLYAVVCSFSMTLSIRHNPKWFMTYTQERCREQEVAQNVVERR